MKGMCYIQPLFHKVIAGEKTKTRRIINPQPTGNYISREYEGILNSGKGLSCTAFFTKDITTSFTKEVKVKSKYNFGETVFLKEPYFIYEEENHECKTCEGSEIAYKYQNNYLTLEEITGIPNAKYKNKLFMPEYASRFSIRINNIRIERLQDISEEDCMAEGIYIVKDVMYANGVDDLAYFTPQDAYKALINKINGKDTWDKNPWVFVYTFTLNKKQYVSRS